MFGWLKRLFGLAETDLSRIVSGFSRTCKDLEAHIAWHRENAVTQRQLASEANAEAAASDSAATKAGAVHARIAELIAS